METHYQLKNYLEKLPNVEIYYLQHAYRLNGIIDVWKNLKTIFVKPENAYLNFENWQEMEQAILEKLEKYPPEIPIKKLSSGRMSYQEFQNNKNQERYKPTPKKTKK